MAWAISSRAHPADDGFIGWGSPVVQVGPGRLPRIQPAHGVDCACKMALADVVGRTRSPWPGSAPAGRLAGRIGAILRRSRRMHGTLTWPPGRLINGGPAW
jgi:hypothetical protein